MKKLFKMLTVATVFCSLFVMSIYCQTEAQSDDEAINRAKLKKFSQQLAAAKDFNLLDEIFIPEGMTKEQFIADCKSKAQAIKDSVIKKLRQEELAKFNKNKEVKKCLTCNKIRFLKRKGEIKDDEIINNSSLSVGERKEKIAFLYYIDKSTKRNDFKIMDNETDCVDIVADSLGFGGSSTVDDLIRMVISETIDLLQNGVPINEIYAYLEELAGYLPEAAENIVLLFLEHNFCQMIYYISQFCDI